MSPRYELKYRKYLLDAGIPWDLQSAILTFSPDSSYALDEWLFAVAADSLGLFSCRDPDTQIGLIDISAGTADIVLSGGTPLMIHVTCWLGPTSFVIGGTAQNATVTGFHLMIWQYDLTADTVHTFRGPYLEGGTPRKAVASWVAARFPSIRR
jgi:hypothetical protein